MTIGVRRFNVPLFRRGRAVYGALPAAQRSTFSITRPRVRTRVASLLTGVEKQLLNAGSLSACLQPDRDFTLLVATHDLEAYRVADGVIVKSAQEPRDAVNRPALDRHDHISWPDRSV
jgi:hypothetical protein